MIIAVDFDGTLCREEYPEIGKPDWALIESLIDAQKHGARLILWTCREGKLLDEAVEWCRERGLEFEAINDNLPDEQKKWGNNPRKIAADIYIDDRAVSAEAYMIRKGRA